MALKNSKFSHLNQALNSVPLRGKDAPPEQSEVKSAHDDPTRLNQPSERQVGDDEWKAKLHGLKTYCKKNGDKIGIVACVVSAFILAGALAFSIQSNKAFKKAEALCQAGDYKNALPELNTALWFNPNLVGALYERGQIYSKEGNLRDAVADFSNAIKINPFYKDLLERRATAYLAVGDYRRAIADYTQAIAVTSGPHTGLWGNRAQAYANIGDYNAAIADYDVAISHAPKNVNLYLGRARCLIKSQQFKRALKDCETAVEIDPKNASAYMRRAWCQHALDENAKATKDIALALQLDPQLAEAYYYRGTFVGIDGKFQQALADFEKAISLNSQDPRFYLLRGETYNQLGDKRKAVADLEKSLKLPPVSYGDVQPLFVLNFLAQLYMDLGDYQNATKRLTLAIAENRQNADSYMRRAKCEMRLGNLSAAVADCDAAIGLKANNSDYYHTRGICQSRLGRQVSAEHDFEKALSIAPRSFDVYMTRGNFYLDRKNYDKATEDFQQACHINPRSAQAKSKREFALAYLRRGSYMPAAQASHQTKEASSDTDKPVALSSNLNELLDVGYRDLARGKAQKSIEELSRAVKLFPNDARARRYLAYALIEDRQPLGALEQFKQLANLGGQTIEDKLAMADALIEVGQGKEALRLLKTCLENEDCKAKVYAKMALTYNSLGFPDKAIALCQEGMQSAKTTEEQEALEAVRAQISSPTRSTQSSTTGPNRAVKITPSMLAGGGG
jgi:tetratricopeptide (TPR) repeat protein